MALIALAAAGGRRTYSDMALALVSAEPAALPALLAPLRLDRTAGDVLRTRHRRPAGAKEATS